jgi:hypothetical protein
MLTYLGEDLCSLEKRSEQLSAPLLSWNPSSSIASAVSLRLATFGYRSNQTGYRKLSTGAQRPWSASDLSQADTAS